MSELSDVDLVRAAQAGDVTGLSLLLTRHRAGMRAVALSVLGFRPDVDDAVQEACLIAVRRIGDLREPAAVGGWLRTVVRHQCLMQLRARTPTPVDDLDLVAGPVRLDPAHRIEQHALGNWIWDGVNALPPEQRLVTMLRYFTDVSAYRQIAALCGIPIGTVRSRLRLARARLAETLTARADLAHDDHLATTRARQQEAEQALQAGPAGRYEEAMAQICTPDLEMIWGSGKRTHGLAYPVAAMYRDLDDGVRFQLSNVVAGPDVLIWEAELLSPPEDPFHCPPNAIWVHSRQPGAAGRTYRSRVFHPVVGPMPHAGLERARLLQA